jgi:hypothetical protein
MKIITDGNPEGLYDRLQYETDLVEREQREFVRSEEIKFLEQQETHAEFCQAMKDKGGMLAEPELPLDEASYRDYRLRRAAGEGR